MPDNLTSKERLAQIRENHRRAWIGVGDSEKYQTQAERDRKDLLDIIANQERPPPDGYDSWYDAAVDERMRRVAAEQRAGAAHEPAAVRSKFDLAHEILRQLDAEQMDTMQSCHFGYVLRVTREGSAQPPTEWLRTLRAKIEESASLQDACIEDFVSVFMMIDEAIDRQSSTKSAQSNTEGEGGRRADVGPGGGAIAQSDGATRAPELSVETSASKFGCSCRSPEPSACQWSTAEATCNCACHHWMNR